MSYARVDCFCEYKNQSDSCNSVTQCPRKTCHLYISIQHHTDFYKFYGKSDTTLDTAPFDKGPIDIKFERNSPKKNYKIFLYVVFSEKILTATVTKHFATARLLVKYRVT